MKTLEKTRLWHEAVRIAELQVGLGESPPGSNAGPDVTRYLRTVGLKPPSEWCAALVSFCLYNAAQQTKLTLPFDLSGGARALIRNVGAVGRLFTDPGEVVPGDLIAWYRGPLRALDWRRHVGMVIEHAGPHHLRVLAGNEGRNGIVRLRIVDVASEPRFWTFASIHTALVAP